MEDAIELCPVLKRNIEILSSRLGAPANADVLRRRFQSGAFESALIAVDGMVNTQLIDENILDVANQNAKIVVAELLSATVHSVDPEFTVVIVQ